MEEICFQIISSVFINRRKEKRFRREYFLNHTFTFIFLSLGNKLKVFTTRIHFYSNF